MLTYMSKMITSFFIRINAIESDKKEVYEYSFEVLLASIFNLLSILIIAIFSTTYFEALLFCVGFLLLRSAAGGYHAKTHLGCFLILSLSYISCVLMIKFIGKDVLFYLSIAFAIISIVIIFLLAPIQHENNPFFAEKKHVLSIRSIIYIIILSASAIAMQLFIKKFNIGFSLSFGIFVVSTSLVFAFLKKKLKKSNLG